ncbi:endomucin-like isoform X2 [Aphelocoma coerulescens]|uniref:endomucin-like isoform X2 n=1 Tax=Aphelocoma coerulescens TaxID=39617 RepID=UPI00360451CC
MGRPPSSDNDNLHRRQGRRDQQLDPLHTGQKGPLPMVGGTPISHKNGVQSQKLMLLLLLLSKIIIVETFVKITIPESRVWVPENSNVNLTCLFVDDQGAGWDRVGARWKWITKDQIQDKGVETVWDEKQQKGLPVSSPTSLTTSGNPKSSSGNQTQTGSDIRYSNVILPIVITLIVITLSVFSLVALYKMCQKKTPERQENGAEQAQSDKEGVKLLSVKTTSSETGEHSSHGKNKTRQLFTSQQ